MFGVTNPRLIGPKRTFKFTLYKLMAMRAASYIYELRPALNVPNAHVQDRHWCRIGGFFSFLLKHYLVFKELEWVLWAPWSCKLYQKGYHAEYDCSKDMESHLSFISFTFHYLAFLSHDSFPYLSVLLDRHFIMVHLNRQVLFTDTLL